MTSFSVMHFEIQYHVWSKFIPGKMNVLPDMLSRLQIGEFRRTAVDMNNPPEILNRVDWKIKGND